MHPQQHHTTKTKRLENYFVEIDTANLLLCLRVNAIPSLPVSTTGGPATVDNEEDILESIKTKVRAEAPIIYEKYAGNVVGYYSSSSSGTSGSSGSSGSEPDDDNKPDDVMEGFEGTVDAIETESKPLDSAMK